MKEAGFDEIADFIRARSRAGELASFPDIDKAFGGALSENREIIRQVMLGHQDIKEVLDSVGRPFHYSELFMTGAYAAVLALKGEGDLRMMAEVIRENSRTYSRPVNVSLFLHPPFNLTEDRIPQALDEMRSDDTYSDISQSATSIGGIFAYSSDYLDHDHAVMLAEWFDVGQMENP